MREKTRRGDRKKESKEMQEEKTRREDDIKE